MRRLVHTKKNTRTIAAVPADIPAALDQLGIDYVIRGNEAVGLCPNPKHDDHSPSWSCNLESGKSHCFSCGWGGSFSFLVMVVKNKRFEEADLWVRTHRVRTSLDGDEIIVRAKERRAAEVRESDLWDTTEPPESKLRERNITLEAAAACEVLWHFAKDCWIFPVRDASGRLLGWQEKSKRVFRNRPSGLDRRRSLFGFQHLQSSGKSGRVVVVESPVDVARFITAGIHRVVSTFGVEFTDEQIKLLWKYADEIVFAMDHDSAGHRKVSRWLKEHPGDAQYCYVFDYGDVYEDRLTHEFVHPAGDKRDPGNLSDDELRYGVEMATPAWRTRFEDYP